MIKKILFKLVHITLVSILFFFIVLMLINVFSTQLLNLYFTKLFENKVSVHIGKVKRIFLPLSLDVTDVSIKDKNNFIFLKEGSFEINLRAFFSKRAYLTIYLKDIRFENNNKQNKKNTNFKFLISGPVSFNILKDLDIENIAIKNGDKKIFVKNITVHNKKNIQFFVNDFSVCKKNLKLNSINLNLIGKLYKNKLLVQSANLNGSDIKGNFSGFVGEKGYYANFNVNFGTRLLKLIDNKLKGKVEIKGKVTKGVFDTDVFSDKLFYSNEPILFVSNFKGTLKNFKYNIKQFKFRNINIKTFGKTDLKRIEGKGNFITPLIIFKDNQRKFTVSKVSYIYNVNSGKGFLRFGIIGLEHYDTYVNFHKIGSEFYLEKISMNSVSVKLTGSGSYKEKSLRLSLNGEVKNNNELIHLLKTYHSIKISLNIKLDKNGFGVKGNFYGLSPIVYHNLKINKYNGNFELNKGIFDFNLSGKTTNGKLEVVGHMEKEKKNYMVKYYNIPFKDILGYFNVKSKIKASVNGEANILVRSSEVFVTGKIDKIQGIDSLNINFSYSNKRLYVDRLVYKGYIYINPGYIDFQHKKTYFYIKNITFSYEKIKFRDLSIKIKGYLLNPEIKGFGRLLHDDLGKSEINFSGRIKNIHVNLFNKKVNVSFNAKDLKEIKGVIVLTNYELGKKIRISSFIFFKSKDLIYYNFTSSKSLIYYKNNMLKVNDLQGNYANERLTLTNGFLSGQYFDEVKIKKGIFSQKDFVLKLIPKNIKFEKILMLKCNGDVLIKGNYNNINIFAKLYGKGNVNIPQINFESDILYYELNINQKKIYINLIGKKFDTNIRLSIYSDNIYQIDKYNMILTGENIFVSKSGFSGVLNVSLLKNAGENKVKGNIFITKGIFNFKKIRHTSKNSKKFHFPIDFNINISSVKPLEITDRFVHGHPVVDLNVAYEKDNLKVTGIIRSVNSFLIIANEKFFVEKGYLQINKTGPPYFYVEAVGEGSFNSLVIKIYGFLPNYTVEIEDLNPRSSIGVFNKGKTQSKNVISSFFTGSLLKNLTKYTEKLLGINKIGLEETSVSGSEMKDYFKIGRKFSDRLEIKYLVDTEGKEESVIVGEYLLFDWMKFEITHSAKEGSGAGITFFTNF